MVCLRNMNWRAKAVSSIFPLFSLTKVLQNWERQICASATTALRWLLEVFPLSFQAKNRCGLTSPKIPLRRKLTHIFLGKIRFLSHVIPLWSLSSTVNLEHKL
ncbi:hypothetical protein AVEN_128363-1 [Araneus ventricosus]|uniref:Uncharacterized protein n=1 Tax=Araneus ventricosus TaxID=182803 RepID=A0A4Y2DBX6_ARAVE|nr:hypothetical protein AVEN_128363-1 [Araneus ventricosus]